MTDSAASSSARAEIPTLATNLTPMSLFLTILRGKDSTKVSNYPSFRSGVAICLYLDEFANAVQQALPCCRMAPRSCDQR
jgi:hypothetical protein